MSKTLSWLDKFAEDRAKNMKKTASVKKQVEQIIVDLNEIPDVEDGQEVLYNDCTYKVINCKFCDEVGPGVVLEKVCEEEHKEVEGELQLEMAMEMGVDELEELEADKKVTDAPERAVDLDSSNADLHIEVRDSVEVDKFQEEAEETEKQILLEDSIDRTTPEGKYNRIELRIQKMHPIEDTECEEFVDVDEDGVCDECGLIEEECPAVIEELDESEELVDEEEKTEKDILSNRIYKKLKKIQ